ncbi:Flagellar protein FlgJ [peptidoglycan hydrolase] [hydrothermal vent metagenome]|uniref:Flagellar protein FlgJ [peptidoglycan hydrolase] n=1 Tax=hydrothermal vent metagenome TaxID=652676 RepID=A0A3B0TNV6_9ZZZZ
MSATAPVAGPEQITQALRSASRQTGAEFDYLLQTAKRESGLNAAAKASTSSATGLFQFIEGTWMETVKASGAKYGLSEAAAAIQKTPSGRYEVADPKVRAAILALRTNPAAAALMAGEFTQLNAQKLQARLGRAPSQGELYIAHFLGAGGAGQLISAVSSRPGDNASQLFPAAAKANTSIFYTQDGQARTVEAVYRNLVAKHQQGGVAVADAGLAARSGPLDITPDRAKAGLAPFKVAGLAPGQNSALGPTMAIAAYVSPDRPLHSLFAPSRTSPATEPSPARRQSLVATLKAYGVDPAPAKAKAAPNRLEAGGRPLWGGGLFTNAQVKPGTMQGGLFTVPAGYAR